MSDCRGSTGIDVNISVDMIVSTFEYLVRSLLSFLGSLLVGHTLGHRIIV